MKTAVLEFQTVLSRQVHVPHMRQPARQDSLMIEAENVPHVWSPFRPQALITPELLEQAFVLNKRVSTFVPLKKSRKLSDVLEIGKAV